jgi:hypothetical protein
VAKCKPLTYKPVSFAFCIQHVLPYSARTHGKTHREAHGERLNEICINAAPQPAKLPSLNLESPLPKGIPECIYEAIWLVEVELKKRGHMLIFLFPTVLV